MKPAVYVVTGLLLLSGCQSSGINQPLVQNYESADRLPIAAGLPPITEYLSVTSPPQDVTSPPQGLTSKPEPAPAAQPVQAPQQLTSQSLTLSTASTMTAPPQGIVAPPQGIVAPPQGIAAPPQGVTAPPMSINEPLEQDQFQHFDSNGDSHWNKAELGAYQQDWRSQYQGFSTKAVVSIDLSLDSLLELSDYNHDLVLNFGEAFSLHEGLRTSLHQTASKATEKVTEKVTGLVKGLL